MLSEQQFFTVPILQPIVLTKQQVSFNNHRYFNRKTYSKCVCVHRLSPEYISFCMRYPLSQHSLSVYGIFMDKLFYLRFREQDQFHITFIDIPTFENEQQ